METFALPCKKRSSKVGPVVDSKPNSGSANAVTYYPGLTPHTLQRIINLGAMHLGGFLWTNNQAVKSDLCC